ncbi:hypothetical protein [Rhodanobacter lindaniclasticus]
MEQRQRGTNDGGIVAAIALTPGLAEGQRARIEISRKLQPALMVPVQPRF